MQNQTDIGPEDSCLICCQKHFLAAEGAIKEPGYENSEKNHDFAIRELVLAAPHVQQDFPALAQQIRDIRHFVQYWQYSQIGTRWDVVKHTLNVEIRKELFPAPTSAAPKHSIPSTPVQRANQGKIYVFSNVKYPEKNKIKPAENDLLVFLNIAETIDFYADHKRKIVFHRDPKEDKYGKFRRGCRNSYVFNHPDSIPRAFIDNLKKSYDWNYEIEEGKVKCMTTGYMVTKWMQQLYPQSEIILVNFGYEVQKSTYRCPWHNWKFEAEDLKSFKHIFLEEQKS